MRGPWSRKQPQFVSIKPVEDKAVPVPLGKAKRVQIKPASEANNAGKGS